MERDVLNSKEYLVGYISAGCPDVCTVCMMGFYTTYVV